MESYKELYNSISNPIENPELYDILIEQYSDVQDLYNVITSVSKDKKKKKNINQKHKDGLAVSLFNYWSQSIREQESNFINLKKASLYQKMTLQEFMELRRILEGIGKVSSIHQLNQIIDNYPLIENYLPNKSISKGDNNSWTYISSDEYDRFDEKKEIVEHRLYINVENENLYELVNYLIKKMTDRGLPYNFKYSELLRDDSVVIYADKDYLNDYIQILREIKKEKSYLFSDYLKPPILTGKIDGWIGYGSEPGNDKKSSFNSKRIGIIENCIDEVFYSYITNSNFSFQLNNKSLSVNEYYAGLLTKEILNSYSNQLINAKTKEDIEKLYENYGFLPSDLNNVTANRIYEEIKPQIPKIISGLKNKKYEEIKFEITTRKGKMDSGLSIITIKRIIKSLSKEIYMSDKTFIQQIIRKIMIKSRDNGIDVRKYCFDVDKRDELLDLDKKNISVYQELYNSISNPLDSDEVITKLIIENSSNGLFYNSLTQMYTSKKNKKMPLQREADLFYIRMFEIWKRKILSLDNDDIERIIKTERNVDEDFRQLQSYIRTLGPITSKDQYIKLVFSSNNDLLKKYGWQALNGSDGWLHVSSRYLNGKNEKAIQLKHRLYVSVDMQYLYQFVSVFLDKCRTKNIPFYFKFKTNSDRDDTMVIYSDNINLIKYVSILREIRNERKEFFQNKNEPPILTGKIDGWIGYGSEPLEKASSFNLKRANIIQNSIYKSTIEWLNENLNKTISAPSGKLEVTFGELVSGYITRRFQQRCFKNLKGKWEKCDFTIDDLNDNTFRNEIYFSVVRNIKEILAKYKDGKSAYRDDENLQKFEESGKRDKYEIKLSNNKKIVIDLSDVRPSINELGEYILKCDKSFIGRVRQNIKEESEKQGVDENNFSFDVDRREELFKIDELQSIFIVPNVSLQTSKKVKL